MTVPEPPLAVIGVDSESDQGGLERVGLGFRMRFPSHKSVMELSRIRESSGDLAGELKVAQVYGTFSRTVLISAVNLKSLTTRNTLTNALKLRVPGVPWLDLVDAFALEVLAAYRGRLQPTFGDEPGDDAPTVRFLPRPLLSPALIFGPPGSGKTTMVLAIAKSAQFGREIVSGFIPNLSGPFLWLDYETNQAEFRAQERAVEAGAGLDRRPMAYLRMSAPLADCLEEIASIVTEHAIAGVVVDGVESASGAGSDHEGVNARVIRLFEAVRVLETMGAQVVLIDHPAGADFDRETPAVKPIGGSQKVARARSMFEVKAEKEPSSGRVEVAVIDVKRNRRARQPTRGLAIAFEEFDDHGTARVIRFDKCDLSAPDLIKKQNSRERLVGLLLARGSMSVRQAAAELEISENAIRTYAGRDDRIIRLQDGNLAIRTL